MGPKPTATSISTPSSSPSSVLGALRRYVLNHPYDTAFTAAGVFLCLNPMALLGCGPLVPVAGPAASSLQSTVEILQRGLLVTKLQQAGFPSVSVALWRLAGFVAANAPRVAGRLLLTGARIRR